jgi:hypothetical protein
MQSAKIGTKKKFNFVFRWKMQKDSQKTHFGNIDGSNLRFYWIILKFRPRVQKEFLLINEICKTENFQKTKLFDSVLKWKMQKKTHKRTHFGNIDGLDLRFYSIASKLGSQVQVRTLTLIHNFYIRIIYIYIYYILHHTKTNSKKVKQKYHFKTTIMYTHTQRL